MKRVDDKIIRVDPEVRSFIIAIQAKLMVATDRHVAVSDAIRFYYKLCRIGAEKRS